MGFSSQTGVTVIGTQDDPGEFKADLATTGVAMRLTSGAMTLSREALIYDPEIGGGRDISDAFLGPASAAGSFEFYPRFGSSTATLLRAALGAAESEAGSDSAVYTHSIVPVDDTALPYLSIYQQLSSGLERSNFTDVVVNTFHLEADANGFLTGSVELIGKDQTFDAPVVDPTALYDTTTGTVGTSIRIMKDGVNLKPKSFSLDINNNFEDDDFRLGQFHLEDLTPKRREITLSTNLRHEDRTILRQALMGSAAATELSGQTDKSALVIEIVSYQLIEGASAATPHKLTITIPEVMIQPFSIEPSGDDILENDVEWQAVRPDPAVPIMTAELQNGVATIA